MAEGWSAQEVFAGPQGLCLGEVAFLPGPSSKAGQPVDLATRLTRNIELRWPFASGPASSVTEANMAIAMALQGGVGIIHRSQPIAEQAEMVRKVKRFATGFILQCFTLKPWSTVAEARKLQEEQDISCIPVTDNGRMGGKLMGIVTRRDLDAVDDETQPLKACMQRDVLYVSEPVAIKQAREVMAKARVSKLPVVNKEKELVALLCRGDMKREREYPHATRDANRSLIVAAAVNPLDADREARVEAVLQAGADLLCVDTSDGVLPDTKHFVTRLRDKYEGVDILAGPVWSCRQAKDLLDAGADGLRVGLAGQREASALYEVAALARQPAYDVPVLADCGAGDVATVLKALCLGASSVTLDGMLRATEEAPGDHYYLEGTRVKLGPGQAAGTEQLVRMGTPGTVVVGGPVSAVLPRVAQGLAVCMRELGLGGLKDVAPALTSGQLRLERQLLSSAVERPAEHPPLQRVAVSTLHCRW